ncbi:transposase [Pseudoduganella sp. R-34]|uniref:transposase n=1 Tax=unclassified Pseudoduganella TaxID=2637179 RepID=UPI003CFB4561
MPRLAREHGVNANQVFTWRKLYEAGAACSSCACAVQRIAAGGRSDAGTGAGIGSCDRNNHS